MVDSKKTNNSALFRMALVAAAVVIGGGVSLFVSANPDGLEWSMEQVAGTSELEASGQVYDTADSIQTTLAVLPNYAFKNSESAVGTSFSGIVGGAIVLGVCVGACYLFKFFRKKNQGTA